MTSDSDNTLTLTLKDGDVKIALRPDLAPLHVARIKELANEGFYDGVVFHRVIPGFMAQTGDPTGTGGGGSKLPNLKAEFSPESHVRGTLSMARTSDPNSANSQFFICFSNAPWLDRQYSVFGQVVSGMEHVDAIKKGGEHNNGAISGEPDRIVKARVGESAN
jgi:cyclophilin family peptidyl-prolyl cis-trans isomerase